MKRLMIAVLLMVSFSASAGIYGPVFDKPIKNMGRFMDEQAIELVDSYLVGYYMGLINQGCNTGDITFVDINRQAERAWLDIKYEQDKKFGPVIIKWAKSNIQCVKSE